MSLSTICRLVLATPFVASLLELTATLLPLVARLGQRIVSFQQGPITPVRAHAFETELQEILCEIGRVIVHWVYNHLETDDLSQAPPLVHFDRDIYRRREHSPRRNGIATLFGVISLWRIRYEPWDRGTGVACIFPLEQRLGIIAGNASAALASRVGQWTAQYTQETVLQLLRQEHQVSWSVATLRTVAADLSAALAPLTHQAQVDHVLALLRRAQDSKGRHRPVLSVGRDGIFVPICKDSKYREAATATVSVLDRSGQRLGTVYLGHMPEAGQVTLSQQLTALLNDVLQGWQEPLPRLQYVTDGGHHPSEYFGTVLKNMLHPRTDEKLEWHWVLDYYHACLYLTKLAEVLFGKETQAAAAWAAKMRRCLRDKKDGIHRVLHSAAAHAWRLEFTAEEQQAYDEAYQYLQKRRSSMDYWQYRRQGLAIGSGITEAACKILFTQRFKQSGMKWSLEGGQVIVELRVIWLSKLWGQVFDSYLQQLPQARERTKDRLKAKCHKIAASFAV
jgi:hypothetical protein